MPECCFLHCFYPVFVVIYDGIGAVSTANYAFLKLTFILNF